MTRATRQRILVFFWTLLAGSWSADAAEIRFRAEAPIRGSLVLLGDVAEITDSDPAVVAQLARIELFPAPARGRLRTIRDVEMRQLLRLHGVEPAAHRFSGAETTRIRHDVPAELAGGVATVVGKPPLTTSSSFLASSRQAIGQADQVVVAKRAIQTGEVLRAIDLEVKSPERVAAGVATTKDLDEVVGHETQRALQPGQPIDTRALRKPVLVRRGEMVSITAKAAGVRVRTVAKALADATLGDALQVENEKRMPFTVVVTGRREAEILAAGQVATDHPRPQASDKGVE